jgi:hypothetical protein
MCNLDGSDCLTLRCFQTMSRPLDPPCQHVIMFTVLCVSHGFACWLISVNMSTCQLLFPCVTVAGVVLLMDLQLYLICAWISPSCHNMVLCLIGSCISLRLDSKFDLYSSKYGFVGVRSIGYLFTSKQS